MPRFHDIVTAVDFYDYAQRFSSYDDLYTELLRVWNRRVLPVDSDPTLIDSDLDRIPDKYTIERQMPEDMFAFDDPNPLKSDVTETKLKNDFFSVDYEYNNTAEYNWAERQNAGNCSSYGGYQGWFGSYGYTKDQKIFCNNTIDGHAMHSNGCGIIAAGDYYMYLLKARGSYYMVATGLLEFSSDFQNLIGKKQ